MIFRILTVLFFLSMSISSYANSNCYENGFLGAILKCKKDVFKQGKDSYEQVYEQLVDSSSSNDFKKQIKVNENAWLNLSLRDCEVYSFFVDDTTITNEIMKLECLTGKYNERTVFLENHESKLAITIV